MGISDHQDHEGVTLKTDVLSETVVQVRIGIETLTEEIEYVVGEKLQFDIGNEFFLIATSGDFGLSGVRSGDIKNRSFS